MKWGARASLSRRTLGAEAVRNGTLQTATGTVALLNTMFNPSSVQPRKLSGLDATELFADFGSRGNLAFGDDGDAGFGGNTICVNIKTRFVPGWLRHGANMFAVIGRNGMMGTQ